jgi:hypothetical protein
MRPAEPDPREHAGEHHGEDDRRAVHEQEQESEPDHFQREERRAREERRGEHARAAAGGRCDRRSAGEPARDAPGDRRGAEVARRGGKAACAQAQFRHEDELRAEHARHRAERIHPVEPPEREPVAPGCGLERLGEQRQRRAERRGGHRHEEESDARAREVERDGLAEKRREKRAKSSGRCGNATTSATPEAAATTSTPA